MSCSVEKQVAIAIICLTTSIPAASSAQTLGTYVYTSSKTTGTMVVTDISSCEQKDTLGCMSAVRPIKVRIQTVNRASASDCDVDAIEATAGRVTGSGKLEALLIITDERSKNQPNLTINFDRSGALVRPLEEGWGIGCGAGVDYAGRWQRKKR